MTEKICSLRLADWLQAAVQTYPQMSEDEPGGYATEVDQVMDDAAAELRRLVTENEAKDALLRQAWAVIRWQCAYSTRWRTRFHADGGQCSGVMADTVPR